MKTKSDQKGINAWVALNRAQQSLLEKIEIDLKNAGLPPLAWYDVLLEIDRQKDGKCRLVELGDAVLLSKSNLTRLIDRLEKNGLVERQACEEDARGVLAVITSHGKVMKNKIWPVYRTALQANFSAILSDGDKKALIRILAKLNK